MENKKISYNKKRKVFQFNCFCGKNICASAFSLHSIVPCKSCKTEFMIGKGKNKEIFAQEMNKVE
jgi:hypothetical protein